MPTKITVLPDGPYKLEAPPGGLVLVDAAGSPIAVPAGRAVHLCRCGLSAKKPFCDATHSREGFKAK